MVEGYCVLSYNTIKILKYWKNNSKREKFENVFTIMQNIRIPIILVFSLWPSLNNWNKVQQAQNVPYFCVAFPITNKKFNVKFEKSLINRVSTKLNSEFSTRKVNIYSKRNNQTINFSLNFFFKTISEYENKFYLFWSQYNLNIYI